MPDGLGELDEQEWDTFIEESGRHGLTPLLYHRLKTPDDDTHVPTGMMQRLRDVYVHSTAANVRRFHELSRILKALEEEGIPVIVLKGAHLAEVVYGEMIGLRPMCDVDLLLRREDLERGQERLWDMDCFRSGKNAFMLDMHSNIEEVDQFGDRGLAVAQLNIDIDGLWQRARPAVIGGMETQVLSPEDLLLHLCTHLCIHHFFECAGLRSLCDVRQTVQHYRGQIEWEDVQRRSERWGVSNAVFLTLLLVRELLGAAVPDNVVESLRPDGFDPEAKEWAVRRISDLRSSTDCTSLFFWLMLAPGVFRKRARYLFRLVFPPSLDCVSCPFPAPQHMPKNLGHYIVRLKDKPWPYVRALWRILLRDEEMTAIVKEENRNVAMRKWLSRAPESQDVGIH
ncbi:MAG: nucleotidyltransferase family protein [Planctomycetes bacterium]|nr:nucleotidyltransferase family protein [Planctomycetota bacterium]